jgi:hypothetical protein
LERAFSIQRLAFRGLLYKLKVNDEYSNIIIVLLLFLTLSTEG